MRPAILIDVDGVLNAMIKHRVDYCSCHPGWIFRRGWAEGMRFPLNLKPDHGKQLQELASDTDADLLWMTTWQDDANREIGPWLALPNLPVVPCPRCPREWPGTIGGWKAARTADWANEAQRPFVQFDDEPDLPDELAMLTNVPHLTVTVDERTGLNDEHVERARKWLQELDSDS